MSANWPASTIIIHATVTIKVESSLAIKSYTNKSQIVILQESTMYNINNVNKVCIQKLRTYIAISIAM